MEIIQYIYEHWIITLIFLFAIYEIIEVICRSIVQMIKVRHQAPDNTKPKASINLSKDQKKSEESGKKSSRTTLKTALQDDEDCCSKLIE